MRAVVHCHGRFQSIIIRDISRGGAMLENAFGLMSGDAVVVELLSGRSFAAQVMWAVANFCGVAFQELLSENDPALAPHLPPSLKPQ
jgi:hypothetical protein